jgi:hypothetical protein
MAITSLDWEYLAENSAERSAPAALEAQDSNNAVTLGAEDDKKHREALEAPWSQHRSAGSTGQRIEQKAVRPRPLRHKDPNNAETLRGEKIGAEKKDGGSCWVRTNDQFLKRELLYRLS